MAKRASASDSDRTGGFDPKKAPKYVKKIEAEQAEIDAIMAGAADEARPHYEEIARIKKEAHDNDNIPRKELNALVQKRKLERRAEAVREKLSDEQKENFDQMCFVFDTDAGKQSRKDAAGASAQPAVN